MDTTTIELQETMLRLAKGIVSARGKGPVPPAIAVALGASPFAGLVTAPVPELMASIRVWDAAVRLARAQVSAP